MHTDSVLEQHPRSRYNIEVLDIIAGLTILGYFLVNGPTLNGPAMQDAIDFAFQNTQADLWYSKIIFSVAVGKFYSLLACLFGCVLAILISQLVVNNWQVLRYLLFLFILGINHALLIWWGDTLCVFSLLALSLILFKNKEPVYVLYVLFKAIFVAMILSVIFFSLHSRQPMIGMAESMLTYQQAGFMAICQQRLWDFLGVYIPGIFYNLDWFQIVDFAIFYIQIYICLLFGYWLYISKNLYLLLNNYYIAQRTVLISFSLTFCMSLWADSFVILGEALEVLIDMSRAAFYGSLIVYLYYLPGLKQMLKPLAYVGRMWLSNYIILNLILSLIFYSYGLGLYGTMGPAEQAPILLLIIISSILFSYVWLKYFNYGPLEWLCQMATYGRVFSLRRTVIAVPDYAASSGIAT